MRAPFTVLSALLLFSLPAAAQQLVIYDPLGPGFVEMAGITPMMPGPVPPTFLYPPAPPLPPVPPGPPLGLPPGDSTFDGTTGLSYYTDGITVASTPTVAYPPVVPPPPPFPIGLAPALVGPVTGMALDPVAGILWLSDGLTIVGTAPVPGTPIVFPPFPSPTPPVVGLEWDGLTGTLLVLDAGGAVWTLLPGGAIVGGPLPPPPLAGPPMDVAIDKTGVPGPAGAASIYVLSGPVVFEVMTAMPLPAPVSPMAVGLAFHPYPAAAMPPVGVCPCPTFAHGVATTGPMVAGNAAFGLSITGLPPGQFALFAFDFAFNPAFPLINGIGCSFGLFLGSATMVSGVAFSGPGGVATYALPLLVPPGTAPIYHQSGTLCPADPMGFVVNPLQMLSACGT